MEEFASLWSYQENIEELKQKLLYTTLELEAIKAENDEEMKRNTEMMKQLLQSLKVACQERDEAKNQLQKLLLKIKTSNDQQIFKTTNPLMANCFNRVQEHHQGPLMIPAKANSSVTESNSLSEAYNHSSSPVDSLFDPISSPEFSNVNVETPFVQDYDQKGGYSNSLNGLGNVQKVDQATLVMDGMIKGKTLPQKGKLLQAVVEAARFYKHCYFGPLPRWRNPPSLKTFHVPSIMDAGDHITAAQNLDAMNQNKLLKSPVMMLKPSQPYAQMACGSSSQMMAHGSGGSCGGSSGVLSFGGLYQGSMVAACPSASNLGPLVKKQRLH